MEQSSKHLSLNYWSWLKLYAWTQETNSKIVRLLYEKEGRNIYMAMVDFGLRFKGSVKWLKEASHKF